MSWNHETPSGPVVPNTLLPTTFVPGIALAQPPLGQDTSGTWPLAPAQDFLTTANQLIGTPPPQGPFYGMVPMVPVAPYPGAQPLENGPEPVMTSSLPIRFGAEMAGDVMESGVSRVLRGDGPAVDSFCQPLWQPVLPQPPQCRVPVTTAGPLMPSRELGALHYEIQRFERECLLTKREASAMDSLLKDLDKRIRRMFPEAKKIVLYGSQATGLALPSSDLDIVVLGVGTQIFAPAEQFTTRDRKRVLQRLKHLRNSLERNDYLEPRHCKLVEARIPIMKATLQSKNLQFKTDISIGVKNAADAVGLICQYVSRTPIVRPLVLVLKALLKEKNLNEVYTGGISSYVLFNLGRTLQDMLTMEQRTEFLKGAMGSNTYDLGVHLLSFLDRYGNWDCCQNEKVAISIAKGGLCPRDSLDNVNRDCILCVEDPQALGRNASGGSYKMRQVLEVFAQAAKDLRLEMSASDGGKESSFQILSSIMSCKRVLSHAPMRPDYCRRMDRRDPSPRKRCRSLSSPQRCSITHPLTAKKQRIGRENSKSDAGL